MFESNFFDQLVTALNQSAIVSITDVRGRVVFGNEKFCEITGYSLPEILGKDHRILSSGYHTKEFYEKMWSVILSGKVWSGEIQNKNRSGQAYWEQRTISAIVDNSGQVTNYVAIGFEITNMKQAQLQLSESSCLASLGEMASGIAHEINNPLTIILGRLAIAQKKLDRKDTPENIAKELQTIERTVFRISNIVSGLRKLSRDASFDPVEVFDIVHLINESKELFMQKLNKFDVKFIFENKDAVWIEAKPLQVSQTLLNLINNSADAIENLSEKWVQVSITKDNGKCTIEVKDSGSGIPADILKKIMTPFFTTKEPGRGTGLGLSLSKKMIEDSNGRLYYNEASPNTSFCIELNLGEPKSEVA